VRSLAIGKLDAVINIRPSMGLSSAAGKLFITEAGGKVTNIKGEPRQRTDTMLCTNGKIHDKLVEIIK
jgi:myo-inositol-1(or 4)-monophosphatase